jgi:hypothetical protein
MTQPAVAPAAAPVTTITTTAKRPGWGASEWVDKMLGAPAAKPVESAAKPTIMKAAGLALADGVTVSVTGGLLGAAHAKGWLDVGRAAVDGIIGGLGLAVSAVTAPFFPTFSRVAGNVGKTGIVTFSFRKGFEAVSGKPMIAGSEGVIETKPGEDRIAKVAAELEL